MNQRFLINKYSQKKFNQKINKRSSYLNHLPNQNSKSLKSLRTQKINILYDEISGNNKFKRDYLLFDPMSQNKKMNNKEECEIINMEKNFSQKIPILLPYLKIIMTSPNEKEYPEKYVKKDFMIDDFSGIYLKPKPMSLHKIKQTKIENNSYKQNKNNKKPKKRNSSEFYLPILNKNHFLCSEIKNNKPFFSNNNFNL